MRFFPAIIMILLCNKPLAAQDVGAITSGNWNNPAIWTSGAVPNAGNNVYIGSNGVPSGSALNATVSLTQNQSANDVYLGYQGGNGTLNLANSILTANSLHVGLGTGTGSLNRGTGSFQVATLDISNNTLALSPSDTVTSVVNLFLNGSFTNEGAFNNVDWLAFLSSASLQNGNDTIRTVTLQGSQIHVTDAPGQTTGLTLSDFHTSALSISSDSKLLLDIDGQGSDWIFRWQNPVSGNHITDINNLITGNRIAFSNPSNFPYQIFSSADGYTYIANAVPEPSSIFFLAAGGLCGLGYCYYRNCRPGKETDAEELLL